MRSNNVLRLIKNYFFKWQGKAKHITAAKYTLFIGLIELLNKFHTG